VSAILVTAALFPVIGAAVSRVMRLALPYSAIGRTAAYMVVGVAANGLLMFLLGLARAPLDRWLDGGIFAVACLVLFMLRRREPLLLEKGCRQPATSAIAFVIPLALLLLFAAIFPVRDYDGRVTWLPKARAIAHEGRIDGRFFEGHAGLNLHNRYPLLLPLDAAAVMTLVGDTDNETARWLYAFLALATLVVARELVAAHAPLSAGWIFAGVAWLPVLVAIEGGATSTYADVAVAAFGGLALLMLAHPTHDRSTLRTGALMLGALVLTKNEGIVIAVAVIAAAIASRRLRRVHELVTVAGPVIAMFGLLMLWHSRVPAAYDEQYAILIRVLPHSPERIPTAVRALVDHAMDLTSWGLFWPATALAAIGVLLTRGRARIAIPLITMLILLAIYTVTLAVTSWSISELANVAANRLLQHLLIPAALILAVGSDTASALISRRKAA